VIVLEGGKIVQQGKPGELVKEKGLYQRLWRIQNDLEDEFETGAG
jgi:ATP-binding cassette subfamily B protein